MALIGKLSSETAIKAPAHKFHDLYCRTPHHISNACPGKIHHCHLHEGNFGTPGSIIEWKYTINGITKRSKQVIESIDEENKSITFKVVAGDILTEYTSFKTHLQTISKGDLTLVIWTLEYEKLNKQIRAPIAELEFLLSVNEHNDGHLLQA